MSQRGSSSSSKVKRRSTKDADYDEEDNLTNVYLDGLMKEKINKLENHYQKHLTDLQTKWSSDREELLDEISSIKQNVEANVLNKIEKSEEIPEILIETENNSSNVAPIRKETRIVMKENSSMDQLLVERLDSVEAILKSIASGITPAGINPNRRTNISRKGGSRGSSFSPARISSVSPAPPTQINKSKNRLTETNTPNPNSPLNKRQLTQYLFMGSSPKVATDSSRPELSSEALSSDDLEAAFDKFYQSTESIALWQQSYAKQLDEFQGGVSIVKEQLEYALNEMLRYKELSDEKLEIISHYYESSKQTNDSYEQDMRDMKKAIDSIVMESLPSLDTKYNNLQTSLVSNKDELGKILKEIREVKAARVDHKASNNNSNSDGNQNNDVLTGRISALESENKSMRQTIQKLSKQVEQLLDNRSVTDNKIHGVKQMYDNFNASSDKKFELVLDQVGQLYKTVEQNSDTSMLQFGEVEKQLSSHKQMLDGTKYLMDAFRTHVDNNFSLITTNIDMLNSRVSQVTLNMIADDDYESIDKIDVKTGTGAAKLLSIIDSLKADISDEESNIENLKKEKSDAKNNVKEWIRIFTVKNGRAPLLEDKETQRTLFERLNTTSTALTDAMEYLSELKESLGKAEVKMYGNTVTAIPEEEPVPVEEPVDRDTVVKLQSMWRMHRARTEFQNKKVMVNRIAVYMKIWLRRVRKRLVEEQNKLSDDLRNMKFEETESKSKKEKRVNRRTIIQSKQLVLAVQQKSSSSVNGSNIDPETDKVVKELVESITSLQEQLEELTRQKVEAKQRLKIWQEDFKNTTGREPDKGDKKSMRSTFASHQNASIQKGLKVRELDRLVARLRELCGDEYSDLYKNRSDSFDDTGDSLFESSYSQCN